MEELPHMGRGGFGPGRRGAARGSVGQPDSTRRMGTGRGPLIPSDGFGQFLDSGRTDNNGGRPGPTAQKAPANGNGNGNANANANANANGNRSANANGNADRRPAPPSFSPPPCFWARPPPSFMSTTSSTKSAPTSWKSAPVRSPERVRRLALARAAYLLSLPNQQASDDSRLEKLRRVKRVLIPTPVPEEAEDDGVEAPRQPPTITGGYASIDGTRFKGCPVYAIKELLDDRLILRTLGLPHQEIVVFHQGATFNGINLRDFDISHVMRDGDHVVVEKACNYYDAKASCFKFRGLAISFPQFTDAGASLCRGSRWVTHGSIKMLDDVLVVATQVVPNSSAGGDTLVIRAPTSAFTYDDPEYDVESTVVTRAVLKKSGSHAFSKDAVGSSTPWEAESVAVTGVIGGVIGGVKEGNGSLKYGYGRRITVIVAPGGFGHVYVPSDLIKEANDVYGAKEGTRVNFEACINRVPDSDTSSEAKLAEPYKWLEAKLAKPYKWRAVRLERSTDQIKTVVWKRVSSGDKDKAPSASGSAASSGSSSSSNLMRFYSYSSASTVRIQDVSSSATPTPSVGIPAPASSAVAPPPAPISSAVVADTLLDSANPRLLTSPINPVHANCPKCGSELICVCNGSRPSATR